MRLERISHGYWIVGTVTLAVATTAASWNFHSASAGADAPEIQRAGARPYIVCFGHVDMENGVASLYASVPGRVTEVKVAEGQTVSSGETLVCLDDEPAQLRLREAEADVKAAEEQLAQARRLPEQQRLKVTQQKAAVEALEHRIRGARAGLSRKLQLADIQQLNVKEVEAADSLVKEQEALARAERGKLRELELEDASSGIHRAQADLDARRARWEHARRGVRESTLKAPTAGKVLRVLISAGEMVGAQPHQPAILFCPEGERIIRAEAEQEFASHVKIGQPALIQDDATTGPSWRGRVMRISDWYAQRRSILQEPSQANDARTLECLVALDAGQPPLKIGQRVRIAIEQAEAN